MIIIKKIVNYLYQFGQVSYLFVKNEMNSKLKVNLYKRIKSTFNRFHGESNVIYGLNKNNKKFYLPDYNRLKTKFINGDGTAVLNNKLIFETVFKEDISIPKSLAFISHGNIIPLSSETIISSIDELIEYIKLNGKCVIKPTNGGGGTGVNIISYHEEKLFKNDKEIELLEFQSFIGEFDNYFISEFIYQGDFSNSLYNRTVNTIRILTMLDPEKKEAFIPIAVQRVGNKTSIPTDNWSQGGLSCEIDIETGVLSAGATFPKKGKVEWWEFHPESRAQLAGIKIPFWNEIKSKIIKAAEKHPYIKYIGWDIVITDTGFMVIEGNNCSDVNLLQIHKPLLTIPKAKKFYQYYDIVK